jgi:diguanylate cyclase (GGDEF)-like protein
MLLQQARAETGGDPPHYRPGQQLELRVELLTAKGSRAVRIGGSVAWVGGDYFGLSFAKTSDVIVEALRRHDRLARTGSLAEPNRGSGSETRGLARLRHAAQAALPPLLRDLLVMAAEDLLQRAENVSSNTEQQQIFGDINAIEGLRQGDSLTRAIFSAAFDTGTARTLEAEHAAGELSLIDPDDFERWLEASRVASMLDRKFSDQLNAMGSRLAALRGSTPRKTLTVPFEPQHFAGALKDIAKQLELGLIARSALFDSASAVLGDKLGGFYAEINAVLDGMGAPAANMDRKVTVLRPSRPRAEQAHEAASAEPADPANPDNDGGPAKVSSISAGKGLPGQAAAMTVDPELLRQLVAREAKQRQELAQELVTFVSDAPNMTDSLAAWMQLLGEPLAREAASDQAFFQNRQHPLREIVDGLGHLQMFRPSHDLNPADDQILQQISEILQPISSGQAGESELRLAAEAVGRLTSDQSRLYQRNVERVVEVSEGRDRVRRARQAVSSEIKRRYLGRQVPEVVPELMDAGWRAVLEIAAINAVDGDDKFITHLGLLDSVVSGLGGEAFEREPSEPDAKRLFARVEQELATVAFDPFRRNAVESRLRAELTGPARTSVSLVEMPLPDEDSEERASAVPPDGISANAWERSLERCTAVNVGDRIRLLDTKEGDQDLRVAWIRGDREVFVMVDHRGLRVRDIRLAELALGLHQRRIEIEQADGQPLSDRAVDSMLVRMEERLAHQAAHDSLTGLINRQQFHAALEQALAVPGRQDDIGVLLWVDIDQFRLVNDIHGYDTGDRLLVAVARVLEDLPGAKVLGHLGGDRFAIMLPDIGLTDGGRRAQEICELVRTMPFDWSGQSIALSASIGVVGMEAAGESFSKLLQAADDALGAAKASGGNTEFLYREDDPDIARRKESVHWVVQVDEALERGQLRLRCQPIVPVRPHDGLVPHYEVLLGVQSGAAEPLPIAEFIDAAERYNRMRAVDRWVARTAMEWIAAHREHMPELRGFAVNLSGQTASDPSFVDFVRQQFQRTGIEPSWLSFEVTETAAVADLSRSAGIVHDLKAMGCKVALDDFGSGLASYSYLKELPVDWLKIDGVFVRKIAANREDFAVVKSINEIGHFLGKKTIAEYVADDEILRLVREIGVDYAQGFGISPPILLDDLLQTAESA